MRARTLALSLLAFVVAAAAGAQSPPLPSPPPPVARACTRDTLLDDRLCTIEGRTVAQPPSGEQAKENQRQARVLLEDLCAVVAHVGQADAAPGVLQTCLARGAVAIRPCGGDGTRRLLDEAGRFNPGHARCYGALGALLQEMSALAEAAASCCACVAASCGGQLEQCLERLAAERSPDVPASCVDGACAAACAESRMLQRRALLPSPSRTP